jgi:hypothetical protein
MTNKIIKGKKRASAPSTAARSTRIKKQGQPMASPRINRIPIKITAKIEPKPARNPRANVFAYMKAPGVEHAFEVGDTVEVYCDHEKNNDRIRGWIKGIVVQVDNKMVAVQFRSNVFLTDGWMVPDRILWYPVNSEHIRPVAGKKSARKEKAIPDY